MMQPTQLSLMLAPLLAAAAMGCSDPSSSGGDSTGEGTSSGGEVDGTAAVDASTSSDGADEGSSGSTAGQDESTTGEPEPLPPLEWLDACVAGGLDLTTLHPALQCTAIEVPLDWDEPDGEQILVGAVRVPTTVSPRRGEFWMLDGGPGSSGLGYLFDTVFIEATLAEGWDIVIPSHRGTLSPDLTCVTLDAYTQACRDELDAEWGDRLEHFNTVAAARDVAQFITRSAVEPDESTILYGLSYGTYWAQYYAAEFPDQADGIILDSIVPVDADLAAEEFLVEERAAALLQECVDDPICGPRVGFASGAEFGAALRAAIDNGDCGPGDTGLWEDTNYRNRFGGMINTNRARNLFPLIAALLQRCDPALTGIANAALNAAQQAAVPIERQTLGVPTGGTLNPYFSGPLQAVVFGTTLIGPDADPEAAMLAANNHIATLGFAQLETIADALFGELPNVAFNPDFVAQPPLLLLNGRYDLQTVLPWAEQAGAQHGVAVHVFDDARHGVALTDAGGEFPDGTPCARAMVLEFAADPSGTPDATCVGELPGIDVNLQRPDLADLVLDAFGVADAWSLLPAPP